MHHYQIIFNTPSRAKPIPLRFARNTSIMITVASQKAKISFDSQKKYTVEELTSFSVKLFRDSYRKVLLLHMIRYQSVLTVKKMEIIIDHESVIRTSQDPNFPYLFTTVNSKTLRIPKEWEILEDAIMSTTKSQTDEDLRFSALFSCLNSQGKAFEIDRFNCLWTSINAVYSFIAQNYEAGIIDRFEDKTIVGNLRLSGKDGAALGALIWLISPKYQVFNRADSDKLWNHNYSTERFLQALNTDELTDLYETSFEMLTTKSCPEKYQELQACAERFGLDLYTYLLLYYPYHWRCQYFHGSKPAPLIMAYNDYEWSVLHTINYFLERFLQKEIPLLFKQNYWTEEKQEKIYQYLIHIEPKNINRLKQIGITI